MLTVNGTASTNTSVSVAVAHPSAMTFDKFVLTVCPVGITTGCATADCLPAGASTCAIAGLSPGQTYLITAVAVKGGATVSMPSAAVAVTALTTYELWLGFTRNWHHTVLITIGCL